MDGTGRRLDDGDGAQRSGRPGAQYEFTLLRQEPNGDIFYVASPSKQSEASFKLTSLSGGEAVFENPQHDFPKRIVYARRADGSLLAAIEGPGPDGKLRRVEYPFKRVTP